MPDYNPDYSWERDLRGSYGQTDTDDMWEDEEYPAYDPDTAFATQFAADHSYASDYDF